MNFISAVDMFKIGIGPSSSHTFGPWRAALRFMQDLRKQVADCSQVRLHVEVDLYGSLARIISAKDRPCFLAVCNKSLACVMG